MSGHGEHGRKRPRPRGEHASGVVYEPGFLRRAANGQLVTRAMRHGVAGRWIEALELPSSMSVVRAERPPV
jgi:hypothetical protein